MIAALNLAAAESGVDVEVDVREEFRGYATRRRTPCRCASPPRPWPPPASTSRSIGGGGGSDSNVFNAAGLPAVTLGVGFENVHSPQERMRLDRLEPALRRWRTRSSRAAGATG